MSSSTPRTTRQTRATTSNIHAGSEGNLLQDLLNNLHSSGQFIDLYNRSIQSHPSRSVITTHLCRTLVHCLQNENLDRKIPLFVLDCLTNSYSDQITDALFKEDLLPFFKHVFTHPDDDQATVLSTLRCLSVLVQHRSSILLGQLAEWLSSIFHFLVTSLSPSNYAIYDPPLNELLGEIVQQFSPLSKDIVDVLSRTSSTIISSQFLNQLKTWIDHVDDLRFSLFALQLWQTLAKLFTRLIIRNHTKGTQLLTVLDDAFTSSNHAIQSAAFTVWSSFISHLHQSEDFDPQSSSSARLLKFFLNPFLSDSTSMSKSASISKCHAWLILISFYPKNVNDIILPFLSFAFGKDLSSKSGSTTTTAWWSECRQIAAQYLHQLLLEASHAEHAIRIAADQLLHYVFDFIFDQFFESSTMNEEKPLWLVIWNGYLKHLMTIFQSNNPIDEKQRVAINTCLLTRIEHWWIDARIETRLLLKLFESFEQIGFPLAIETVLRDTSVRTKTLSATQNYSSSSARHHSQERTGHCRTTLSDQYLHMMLEHAIRFNDEEVSIEDTYLHVISYLIETLSKTSDENFCQQSCSLLQKCSVELPIQPISIPALFWHIWFRCSTHLIQILNRAATFELSNRSDNQKQDTAMELLLRPFDFNDVPRLDYAYTTLWIQLFKALCRLALLNQDPSKSLLVHLLTELLRNKPAFEQAIHDERNQRAFGLILVILKTLMKTWNEHDLGSFHDRSSTQSLHLFSITQKRSIPSSILLSLTQLAIIVNNILQRILANNENNTQYLLVSSCLAKSTKCSSMEQGKLLIFTYVRDLLTDLFGLCKVYSHIEILLKNITDLIPFLNQYEHHCNPSTTISSPGSNLKQTADQTLLNKILMTIASVFEPTHSSSLLQLSSPLYILAFQHPKTMMRNKARKYWNETFGRLTFLIYPNDLRACLRDLKDKEHLLLPCFLADHDNSNTAGSGAPPSSTDESQLSQQIDIVTPLIRPTLPTAQRLTFSSPTRAASSPAKPSTRAATTTNQDEPVFVPITNNINYNNQVRSPMTGNKRRTTLGNSCLTEKQKEKLRARHVIPLLCDEHSNTQSSTCTMDAPTPDHPTTTSPFNQLNTEKKPTSTALDLFGQPMIDKTVPSAPEPVESVSEESNSATEENVPEESSIAKKLRRSCRPSISARKSLVNKTQKKPAIPMLEELAVVTTATPMDTSLTTGETNAESAVKHPIKSILKRLSPTKPRTSHKRHVVFHDQVKVLVFASPSRRDLLLQQKKKSPVKEEVKSSPKVIPRENLPLRKQPMAARRLSAMPVMETPATVTASPAHQSKSRASKLFHPKDALVEWTETPSPTIAETSTKTSEPIYPSLTECDQPLEALIPHLLEETCSSDLLNEFHKCQLKTIGDLARCTAEQIQSYSFPTLKLSQLEKALATYESDRSKMSSSKLPTDNSDDASPPIATTSEEMSTGCTEKSENEASSSEPMITTDGPLYDVDVLMASFDYENRHSTTKQSIESPRKRCLTPINADVKNDDQDQISPKKINPLPSMTLGDRLKAAAELYQIKGYLPFDDDYVELIRQLLNNPSLTHLEKAHLKKFLLSPPHAM